ncbi:MAG TPA: response regulator [Pyrinomonadaceae bacterium]|nr:response regulator [Pyrinomonadaceae bacterium]
MPDQKVLVVDDDDEFLRSATEILTERGYEVVTANNPTQARKELEHGDADLAILDVRIGVDRKDITGLILARTLAPAMPKVVVTANPTLELVKAFDEIDSEKGVAELRLVGKGEGLTAVLAAVEGALSATTSKRLFWRFERTTLGITCLLLALGFGILATSTSNVRWLLATVTLVIFAVFFVGKS